MCLPFVVAPLMAQSWSIEQRWRVSDPVMQHVTPHQMRPHFSAFHSPTGTNNDWTGWNMGGIWNWEKYFDCCCRRLSTCLLTAGNGHSRNQLCHKSLSLSHQTVSESMDVVVMAGQKRFGEIEQVLGKWSSQQSIDLLKAEIQLRLFASVFKFVELRESCVI